MPVPFAEISEETYAEEFARTCKPVETRRGVELIGVCPRCGHPMSLPLPDRVFMNGNAASSSPPEHTSALCTCSGEHTGRPDDEYGCGAYWNLQIVKRTA
ncbi:hypothetical protein ACIA5C_48015 [Actinoplanes sp. NPDC051343]|uniref:hypothetical protein n=1 Tax=Actinoplanes sp. NPDC051343 TaxID=3363906 RepID=UPI0037AA409D